MSGQIIDEGLVHYYAWFTGDYGMMLRLSEQQITYVNERQVSK